MSSRHTRIEPSFGRWVLVDTESKNGTFVNGQPILIKGVNRHDHDPDTGHYVSEERMREDLLIMKESDIMGVIG